MGALLIVVEGMGGVALLLAALPILLLSGFVLLASINSSKDEQ